MEIRKFDEKFNTKFISHHILEAHRFFLRGEWGNEKIKKKKPCPKMPHNPYDAVKCFKVIQLSKVGPKISPPPKKNIPKIAELERHSRKSQDFSFY